MRVKAHDGVQGTALLQAKAVLQGLPEGLRYGFSQRLFPQFEIADAAATVLGTYELGGAPAFAYRKPKEHSSFYSAVPNLPAALYRAIARHAGVHIYYEGTDPVYLNNRLLGIHMQSDAAPVIHLPRGAKAEAEELFDGGRLVAQTGTFTIPHEKGAAKLYLLSGEVLPFNDTRR